MNFFFGFFFVRFVVHEFFRLGNFFILSFIVLLTSFSCSEYNPTKSSEETIPSISKLLAPSVVYTMSQTNYAISVQVNDPQGVEDIAQVSFQIAKAGASAPVVSGTMVDDGSTGDILPNDGTFATQIQGSLFLNDTGEFILATTATDKGGNTSNTLQISIFVLSGTENNRPEIKTVTSPASITVDSLTFNFLVTAEVVDRDGLDDIDHVLSEFYLPAHPNPSRVDSLFDNGLSGDATSGDGIFSLNYSSALFKEASDHFMRIIATDKFGAASVAAVITVRGVFSQPGSPVIANLVAPDTVKIDPSQVVQVLITIDAADPQGLSDIDFVRFRSFLPNGNEAQDSPFELADDGNSAATGDLVAGDGTYSIIINLPPTGVTPGDFRFVFQARDKSGLVSNIIEHIMTVIE